MSNIIDFGDKLKQKNLNTRADRMVMLSASIDDLLNRYIHDMGGLDDRVITELLTYLSFAFLNLEDMLMDKRYAEMAHELAVNAFLEKNK
jgi:hypothetical protein